MSVSETSSFEDIFRSLLRNPYVLAKVTKMLPTLLTMSSFEEIICKLLCDPEIFVNLEESSIQTIMVGLGREWACKINDIRNRKKHYNKVLAVCQNGHAH
jgi:hypothetical protein